MGMTYEEYIKKIYNPQYHGFPEVLDVSRKNDETATLENFKIFVDAKDNRQAAIDFAIEVEGIVYTQVDTDSPRGDIAYERGFHLMNRTGIYAVAWRNLCRFCYHNKNLPRELHPDCRCSCHR